MIKYNKFEQKCVKQTLGEQVWGGAFSHTFVLPCEVSSRCLPSFVPFQTYTLGPTMQQKM